MHTLTVATRLHREMLDVTPEVRRLVGASGVREGICLVFSPHTTASVTVNENADPDVQRDMLQAFDDMLGDESRFRHGEGNSGGHLLTSMTGPSVALPISQGRLTLGQWQGIYLCEWDGPRQRTLMLQVIGDRATA